MGTRHERVVLTLQDDFSTSMARAAATTALLDKELDRLGRTTRTATPELAKAGRSADDSGSAFRKASADIDTFSGRLGLLAHSVAAFGPAIIPMGAAVAPAIAGIATQFGALALGAGVVVGAFHGLGDTMDAVNKAQLNPTAENLQKARDAMNSLSPAARQAARALEDMRPALTGILNAGGAGFFPGFVDGMEQLQAMAPEMERLFKRVGAVAGDLFHDAAASLASPEWAPFVEFVSSEAPAALDILGRTVGNVTRGIAELWMAMDPASDAFTMGLLDASETFATWAEGVGQTQGFQEFLDYIRETGPQVMETVGSIANAILQIAEAAAPLGGPVLHILEAFADVVATIADSPMGPAIMAAVTAMSALTLATKAFNNVASASIITGGAKGSGLQGLATRIGNLTTPIAMSTAEAEKNRQTATRRGAVALGGAGLAAVGAAAAANAAGINLQNTAMLAGIGMMAGPWGAAAGAAAGATMDLAAHFDDGAEAVEAWRQRLADSQGSLRDLRALQRDFAAMRDRDAKSSEGFWGSIRDGLTNSTAESTRDASDQTDRLVDAMEREAHAAGYSSAAERDRATALRDAADATNEAYDAALGYEGALRGMRAKVKGVTNAFTENGQVRHNLTEDQQSAAAALLATGHAWGDLSASQRAAAGGAKAARAEFVKTAVQLGMSAEAARALARRLYNIPTHVSTELHFLGADAAQTKIAEIRSQLAQIPREVRTSYYVNQVNGVNRRVGNEFGPGGRGALGSFVHAYANGGFNDSADRHLPEIARPTQNMVRVWAEPETQGESYIPHANDYRRPRAKRVLEQTAEKFGGEVQWFANGGIRINPERHRSATESRSINVRADVPSVRVFIGDRELTDVVRTEVEDNAAWSRRQGR